MLPAQVWQPFAGMSPEGIVFRAWLRSLYIIMQYARHDETAVKGGLTLLMIMDISMLRVCFVVRYVVPRKRHRLKVLGTI